MLFLKDQFAMNFNIICSRSTEKRRKWRVRIRKRSSDSGSGGRAISRRRRKQNCISIFIYIVRFFNSYIAGALVCSLTSVATLSVYIPFATYETSRYAREFIYTFAYTYIHARTHTTLFIVCVSLLYRSCIRMTADFLCVCLSLVCLLFALNIVIDSTLSLCCRPNHCMCICAVWTPHRTRFGNEITK